MGIDVLSFVLGKASSGGNGNGGAVLENLPISLDFTNGNQTITAPDGYVVKSATIEKPSDLIAENIRKDKNIAGVVGTMEMPEIVENVPIELDFSNGKQEQKVAAPDGYAVKSIKIQKPADLIPENIAEGVEIAGVVGTHVGGGGAVEGVCYVTFVSDDGTTELFKRAVIAGNDCGDVVSLGLIDAPIKESTNTQTFTHNGWSLTAGDSASDAALKNVTADRTVYAAFNASTRMYTVRFFDGDTLLNTMQVAYYETADYTPSKSGYFFNSWQPSNEHIIADTDCYAQWDETPSFANATWAQIGEICTNGQAQECFKLGDTKTLTFTDGTTDTLEIVGFNHDDLSDGTGKASITMVIRGRGPQSSWGVAYSNGWSGSTVRTYLNSTFYNLFPSDFKAILRSVDKQSITGSPNKTDIVTTSDKVWLVSQTELTGSKINSTVAEGTQYAHFAKGASKQYRACATSSTYKYMLRTVRGDGSSGGTIVSSESTTNVSVKTTNSTSYSSTYYTVYGVCV